MNPDHRHKLILLPPNRVWRTYPGGKTLDHLAHIPFPADSHFAEDWIASATRAINPAGAGVWPLAAQPALAPGISPVRVGHEPGLRDFAELLASDPEYFLGAAHVKKFGAQPQLLVKFLDSGTRLHFQVHPTREFAQRALGAPSGKTEAYYVLGTRTNDSESRESAKEPRQPREPAGHIYVGFQRPPTRAQLREYIVTQDITAIESCFDRITVKPGDTFIIPGGTPHALGAGVFMVEIQEPSDLVVRFEFQRAGLVLPESARFMNRDVDFALDLFNFDPLTPAELKARIRCQPRRLRNVGPGSYQDELIGPSQTDCFHVRRTHVAAPLAKSEASSVIGIVVSGSVMAEVGGESHRLDIYEKFFLPAGLGSVTLTPLHGSAEILECLPPG
jgi:mannose-6-phosphate isomerase